MTVKLPTVTREILLEIVDKMKGDKNALFNDMAASNPEVYSFFYQLYKQDTTDKAAMLGMIVGLYHMIEKQIQVSGLVEIEEVI